MCFAPLFPRQEPAPQPGVPGGPLAIFRWSLTVHALSEALLRLCEMLKYGTSTCLFTQDVNSFTHSLYLQNLEIISLPEKKVCFVSQLNSDFPRPVELIDSFRKVRYMDLIKLPYDQPEITTDIWRRHHRPGYKYPDIFKDIQKILGYLENLMIFRKKNCDIQNFVTKNVLKSFFFSRKLLQY